MYPFERFSESAKKALTLAQEEAERSQQRYVGPEHLVVGILRVSDSVGAAILDMLGVHLDEVRAGIGSLPESLKSPTGQIIPTSRVKRVIEISFQEARLLVSTMSARTICSWAC